MTSNFCAILSAYKSRLSSDRAADFDNYIEGLNPILEFSCYYKSTLSRELQQNELAGVIGDLLLKGIEFEYLKPRYIVRMTRFYVEDSNIFTLEEIGEYYWKFIIESDKIYKQKSAFQKQERQNWMEYYAIPWFFTYLLKYGWDVIRRKKIVMKIWGESQGDWASYLQWPPEEVMVDILDICPRFEDMVEALCPRPYPRLILCEEHPVFTDL